MQKCVSRSRPFYVMMITSFTDVTFLIAVAVVYSGRTWAVEDPSGSGIGKDQIPPWEPVLTPWWDMTFGEGEWLVADCGVFTGGYPQSVGITWLGPNDKPLKVTHPDRVELSRTDKNKAGDTEAAPYSVMTFALSNLTSSDSGVYTCVVDRKVNDRNETKRTNFSLRVIESKRRCGFESDDLCGWTIDTVSDVQWHVHNGRDNDVINRTKGTHFDHTYGASKDIGRFLDLDVQHGDAMYKNATAKLISPLYNDHSQYRCLQFWYIFEGRDQAHLRISLLPVNESAEMATELWEIEDSQNNGWKLSSVNIPPQHSDYHLIIDAAVCFDRCSLAASAIDDVMITDGKCNNDTIWPDNSLRVRLVGGSTPREGQVEVLHDGQWGTICSDQFGQKEAKVICKSLGYGTQYAQRCRNAHFSANSSELRSVIWLEKLACTGKENDLAQCIAKGETWAQTSCTHQEDAGVICSDVPLTSSTKSNKVIPTNRLTTTKVQSTTTQPNKPGTIPVTTSSTPKHALASTTFVSSTYSATLTDSTTQVTSSTTNVASTTTSSSTQVASSTRVMVPTTSRSTTDSTPASTGLHYVTPTTPKGKTLASITKPTKTISTKQTASPAKTNPDIVSLPPEVETYTTGSNAGVAVGIIMAVLIAAAGVGIVLYRRRRKGKKSTYITFGNPSYSREHLPANDFSLESPLTLSSNGYTVLA